jgi:CubicO group peptidase (beta-lactamase class C family)
VRCVSVNTDPRRGPRSALGTIFRPMRDVLDEPSRARRARRSPWAAPLVALGAVCALGAVPPASAQSAASLKAAAQYSAERDGDAVLVFRRDSLVLEDYQNGYDGRVPHPLASGTKTFTCVIAALAQADGLLDLDEPVSRTLAEFRADSLKARVTVRQLLSLTSGLEPELSGPRGDYAAALALPMVARPGARFAYGAASFHVFGEAMYRKLHGEDIVAYLRRRIFVPLGIDVPFWVRDRAGRPHLAGGAVMTARDWGTFGLLLLDGGRWRGEQLVPAAALSECRQGSAANPWYGLGLWLNVPVPRRPPPARVHRVGPEDRRIFALDLPHDLFLAAGAGGQRLYILPTQGLVVVRLGHNRGPEFKDEVFVRTVLGK